MNEKVQRKSHFADSIYMRLLCGALAAYKRKHPILQSVSKNHIGPLLWYTKWDTTFRTLTTQTPWRPIFNI